MKVCPFFLNLPGQPPLFHPKLPFFHMNLQVFPLGQFQVLTEIDPAQRRQHIRVLESTPGKLRRLVDSLKSKQLDTRVRPGAWTIRQTVHHLADSQLQGYLRFRWAMTVENPAIKTFDQDAWALLDDVVAGPIGPPLRLLEACHVRWTAMLFKMEDEHFARTYQHPESGTLSLDQWLGFYAWHLDHHTAQIKQALQYYGWIDG